MIYLCRCKRGSASTFDQRKKHTNVVSCMVCGGKPLGDGSGPLPGSMLSTVGLDLRSVVNPNLAWNAVTKGNRSSSRRPRKCTSLNFGGAPTVEKQKMFDSMSVSESEKLGVTVLGRRFSDNLEQVPPKKRRFVLRSPSPRKLSQDLSLKETSTNLSSKRRLKKTESIASRKIGFGGTAEIVKSNKNHKKHVYSEDLSGISILAAVACSGIEIGVSSTDSCFTSNKLFKEPSRTSIGIQKGGTKFSIPEVWLEESIPLETSVSPATNLAAPCSNSIADGNDTVSSSLKADTQKSCLSSTRDYRLHWDLNVGMDAWDEPCDGHISSFERSNANVTFMQNEKSLKLEDAVVQKDNVNPRGGVKRTLEPMVVSTDGDHASSGLSVSVNLEGVEHKSNPVLASSNSSNNKMELAGRTKPLQNQEMSCPSVNGPASHSSQLEETHNSAILVPEECSSRASLEKVIIVPSDVKDGTLVVSEVSLNCEERSTSGTSVDGVHVTLDVTKGQDKKISTADGGILHANEQNSSTHVECPKVKNSTSSTQEASNSNGSDKIAFAFDNSFNDNDYDTDVSENGPAHVSATEKAIDELQTGYDSQYEDGELREEPTGYRWEEGAGDEVELERVDYGSDDGLDCDKGRFVDADLADFEGEVVNERKVHEANSRPHQRGSSEKVDMEIRDGLNLEVGGSAKDSCQMKFAGWSQLPRRCGNSNNRVVGFEDGMDASSRRDGGYVKCSRFNRSEDTNFTFQRNSGYIQPISQNVSAFQLHGRGRGGAHWVHSSDKQHCESNIHGPGDGVPGQSLSRQRNFDKDIDIGRGRGRGRAGAYDSHMVSKGARERYCGSVTDGAIGSLREHVRERSLSPVRRSLAPHPNRFRMRSRSRTRSRSPQMWPSPRGRFSSRSPSFRPAPRRVGDHMPGFTSIPRSRGSPPHSYTIDARKDHLNRERCYKQKPSHLVRISPERPFRRANRFDLVQPQLRLRPDDYHRSMRPGRFNEIARAGRMHRSDFSDEDNRKHSGRFGIFQRPMRRFGPDDTVKRFLYEVENDLSLHGPPRAKETSGFNGRDCPRNFARVRNEGTKREREGKAPVGYDRGGNCVAANS